MKHDYMISEGICEIENIFFGKTKEEVIEKARAMTNQWPEYVELEDKDIIESAEAGRMEFDLVRIRGSLPSPEISKQALIAIYDSQWGG